MTTGCSDRPGGKRTDAQELECIPPADGGASGPDCRRGVPCDDTFFCDEVTGACRQCLDDSQCSGTVPDVGIECLDSTQCIRFDAAHCDTAPGPNQFTCVGCTSDADCGGKPIPGLCNEGTGVCVNCEDNANCSTDASLSLCLNGNCAGCVQDADCSLFTAPGRGNLEACKEDDGCVQCLADSHCDDTPATPRCKTSDVGEAAGEASINTCVECEDNDDCTDPSASRCSNNRCVACATTNGPSDPDCSHIRAANGTGLLGICDAGTCTECTGVRSTACGDNVCDSRARTCTNRPARGAGLCEDCVSDEECSTTARCVQQTVAGTPSFFCYPLQDDNLCTTGGFALQSPAIATMDTPSALVCLQRETTCPAYLNYFSGQDCNDEDDDEACGPEGRCELGASGFNCTIVCIGPDDCTGSGICLDSGCEI